MARRRFASLRFLGALCAINFKESVALRGAFWMQVLFMLANNLVFFAMWWVFFQKFDELNGWRLPDMAALYAITAGGFGLAVIFGAGSRELSRIITEGDLDTYLTQPKSALLQSIVSRSSASGWGDIASTIVLLVLSGYGRPALIPIALVVCTCSAVIFLAMSVILHSITFWIGEGGQFPRQAQEFLLVFSCNPGSVYSGFLRVVLFTILPAGFMSFLPVELVREFSWSVLLTIGGAATVYAAIAAGVFNLGLRRYESGNRFGVRA